MMQNHRNQKQLYTKGPIVFAFIDSQNLNLSVQNTVYKKKTEELIYHGWRLDFKRFYIYLKDKYKVREVYLFIGYIEEQRELYRFLERTGYKLVFKPTLKYHDGNDNQVKGNVDAELILHAMIQIGNYDKAIIVAGDGDYHCLIEYLVSQNKLLRILIPNKYRYSSLLRKYHRFFAFVSDLRNKLEYKKKRD